MLKTVKALVALNLVHDFPLFGHKLFRLLVDKLSGFDLFAFFFQAWGGKVGFLDTTTEIFRVVNGR